MVEVLVYGWRGGEGAKSPSDVRQGLKQAVGVHELEVSHNDIVVRFITELAQADEQGPPRIVVEGIEKKPNRDVSVYDKIYRRIGGVSAKLFPSAQRVRIEIRATSPDSVLGTTINVT